MGRKRSKATLSSFGDGFPSGNHVANVSRRQNMQNWNTSACPPQEPTHPAALGASVGRRMESVLKAPIPFPAALISKDTN